MTIEQLFIDGKPLTLGGKLGRGGEGEVFRVNHDNTKAIKIYKKEL